jgi:hypothetical protein
MPSAPLVLITRNFTYSKTIMETPNSVIESHKVTSSRREILEVLRREHEHASPFL